MRRRRRILVRAVAPALLALASGAATAQSETASTYTTSDCAVCHEEVATAFRLTPHARANGWNAETGCQACHGDGTAHIESGGEIDAIVRPQALSPREGSDTCLACHQRHEKHFSGRQSVHRLRDVGCADCHVSHSTAENLLPRTGAQLCSDCHQSIVADFDLPRAHPMGAGGPECAMCHQPHTARTLRATRTPNNAACETCHFEKVGPFIYEHDTGIVDGCQSCHEVHGSTNRHLLIHERQVNLCYECHSASLTPGNHSVTAFTTQKCTACHTAIHGSNTDQFFLEN